MITNPEDYPHPLFLDQAQYRLDRIVLDTGDHTTAEDATAVLTFRHPDTGRVRAFHFSGVQFENVPVSDLRGYLPVYVATTAGRGWEPEYAIEVGDTDPGGVWFWAARIEEVTQQPS